MAGDFHSGLQRHAVLEKLHRSKSTKAGLYMELNRREMKTLKDFINNTCKKIKCLFRFFDIGSGISGIQKRGVRQVSQILRLGDTSDEMSGI